MPRKEGKQVYGRDQTRYVVKQPQTAVSPRGVVVAMFMASGGVIIFENMKAGKWPEPSRFVALAAVFVVLSFVGDFAPDLAIPFSILVFLVLLLAGGEKAFETVTGAVKQKKGKGTSGKRTRKP